MIGAGGAERIGRSAAEAAEIAAVEMAVAANRPRIRVFMSNLSLVRGDTRTVYGAGEKNGYDKDATLTGIETEPIWITLRSAQFRLTDGIN